jgi:hypothetical protein
MKLAQTSSILGNTSPAITYPTKTFMGTFQIVWLNVIGSHALFVDRGEGGILVATAHNGFSLDSLVKRIGQNKRVKEQLDYIRTCGGTVAAEHFFLATEENSEK